ncbi:MAG: pilin [Candidatus Nomurabacteria bacterium]|jgi:hypothetical protein|nr:pilin [Candidatus Nomurabacteria bacterium]
MKKLLITFLIATIAWAGFGLLSPTTASAASCDDSFLGFRPWYYGITKDPDCTLKVPGVNGGNDIELSVFIWAIILNALSILFGIVGYLAIGFLIYGGFMYVMARGDPSRIAKGKNTVIRAIIGLIICILASLISSLIVNIITEATHIP